MHGKLLFIFSMITFCAVAQSKNEDAKKLDKLKKASETSIRTTEDSLQGIWISDDTTEKYQIKIEKGFISYFGKKGFLTKDKYFIGNNYTFEKKYLSNKIKTGQYFIVYSIEDDDIQSCESIETLTSDTLALFNKDVGKHGFLESYHR